MPRHPLAELLEAAAKDADITFDADLPDMKGQSLKTVLEYPEYNWRIVKKPVVTHEFYFKDGGCYYGIVVLANGVIEREWDMMLKLIDGKPVQAEFK